MHGLLKIDNMKIPIRQDIIVLPVDSKKRTIGFMIKEKIGICVINTNAICESSTPFGDIDWSEVKWEI